jgi:hypothetical protein
LEKAKQVRNACIKMNPTIYSKYVIIITIQFVMCTHYLHSGERTEAYKYMSLRDNIPHRVICTGSKKKADIFIVISGTGTEKNCTTGAVREVKIGSVLGAVDLFNQFQADPDFQDPEEPTTYVSSLKSGAAMNLSL